MTNDLNSLLNWVCSIRTEVTEFISRMKKSGGTYKYSRTGLLSMVSFLLTLINLLKVIMVLVRVKG